MGRKEKENVDETLSKPLRMWRKPGDLDDLRMRQWRALRAAERVMYDDKSTRSQVISAVHAMTQASRAYIKVVEVHELEERLEAVEKALENQQMVRRN